MIVRPRCYYRTDIRSKSYHHREAPPEQFWEGIILIGSKSVEYQDRQVLYQNEVDSLLRTNRARIISPGFDQLPRENMVAGATAHQESLREFDFDSTESEEEWW